MLNGVISGVLTQQSTTTSYTTLDSGIKFVYCNLYTNLKNPISVVVEEEVFNQYKVDILRNGVIVASNSNAKPKRFLLDVTVRKNFFTNGDTGELTDTYFKLRGVIDSDYKYKEDVNSFFTTAYFIKDMGSYKNEKMYLVACNTNIIRKSETKLKHSLRINFLINDSVRFGYLDSIRANCKLIDFNGELVITPTTLDAVCVRSNIENNQFKLSRFSEKSIDILNLDRYGVRGIIK